MFRQNARELAFRFVDDRPVVRERGTGTIDPPGFPGRTKHNDGASPRFATVNPAL